MIDCRLCFRKEGKAVYISHLDLMRTMQRAFARAELHVKHSEGFNPKPHLVFALPLSVGTSSDCELVDMKLLDEIPAEEAAKRLAGKLPAGIVPVASWTPERKFREIAWLDAQGLLRFERQMTQEDADAMAQLLKRDRLEIEKKSKRGLVTTDILPLIRKVKFEAAEGAIRMSCRVAAQEPGLNPALIVKAVSHYLPQYSAKSTVLRRVAFLDAEEKIFR